MDNKFFITEETDRIELDDQWVDIKHEMSMGDWEKYESSMLQVRAEEGLNRQQRRAINRQRSVPTSIKINTGELTLLEINIKAWSFKDVQVSRENIGKLREKWCRIILEAISERNEESPLAQKDFSKA